MDIIMSLEALSNAAGAGGLSHAADAAQTMLSEYCDTVERDAPGNLIGRLDCKLNCKSSKMPLLLLEAHIDEVGLIVTGIDDDGFVLADACGGVDRRALTAAEVIIHGDKPYPGVFCSTPMHLKNSDEKAELSEITDMGIDVGMNAKKARLHIRPGDRITLRPNFAKMNNTRVCGKSMDNRAGMASILYCLDLLKNSGNDICCDIAVVFAVQEELGCRGSAVSAYRVAPDYAVAVDVSFAYTPDAERAKCGLLGRGPMLGHSPTLDCGLTEKLRNIAMENDIPYQYEVMVTTGTDAESISDARTGVKTALISIPLKYMHTPIEVVDIRDIENSGRMLALLAQKGVESL